jgi:hypothetical protein
LFTGIQNIQGYDAGVAAEKGWVIRLVAQAKKLENTGVAAFVLPQFVASNNHLSFVRHEYNGVVIESAFADKQFFYGKGAGSFPTASAVLSDISALRYQYRYEYKKKYRAKRVGILWSLPIISIYTHKCDISKGWNSKESLVIAKIEDLSVNLYNELKRKIYKENPDKFETKTKDDTRSADKYDGLKYILSYVPVIDSSGSTTNTSKYETTVYSQASQKDETRHISY